MEWQSQEVEGVTIRSGLQHMLAELTDFADSKLIRDQQSASNLPRVNLLHNDTLAWLIFTEKHHYHAILNHMLGRHSLNNDNCYYRLTFLFNRPILLSQFWLGWIIKGTAAAARTLSYKIITHRVTQLINGSKDDYY